jgi:hypothetical protein
MQAWYDTYMETQHAYVHQQLQAQKGKTTPSTPRKRANVAWSKGLVRISASCFSVGTWMRSMFPFSTLSLKKWYLTSMCLVLEWSTGFLATLMVLVLSHMRGTWEHSSPKSLSVYVIQSSWEQQLGAATYSAFVVDWATLDYLREDQETSKEPKNWQVPEVDFLSTRHPAKSASENHEAKEKRTPSTKDQAQECIEDTWRSAWQPADVKSSVMHEN